MKRPSLALIIIFLLGLTIRLYAAASGVGNIDIAVFKQDADIVRQGHSVYAESLAYNYPPTWAYVVAGIDSVGEVFHLPFDFSLKLFLTLVDLCNAVLIALIAGQLNRNRSLAFTAYWLNLAVLIFLGWYGQFEAFAILPLLLAVYLFLKEGLSWKVWALGTAALCIKHIVVGFVWMLFVQTFGIRRAAFLMVGSLAILALLFVPFLPQDASRIYAMVLQYSSNPTTYGFTALLGKSLAYLLLIGFMVSAPLGVTTDLPTAMLIASVGFLTFIPGMYIHYAMLIIPWAVIRPSRYLNILTVGVFIYKLHNSLFINHPLFPGDEVLVTNLIWVVCLIWFIALARKQWEQRQLRLARQPL